MTVHVRQAHPALERTLATARLAITPKSGFYRDFAKRVFDLAAFVLLAPSAALILAIVIPIIALDGSSPFYRQERIGRNGRVFKLWKLRSMVPDADKRLAEYLDAHPDARAEWDHHQKLKNDPRITRIGRFIRRTSIDELPQLINVLMGEMSLVGPRPMMVEQMDLYPGHAYFALTPGITGFWQIADRHESSFAERAFFDMQYYNALSLGTDLSVMVRTIGVVMRADGV